ncbi:sodium/calcium exchanger membrane region [Kribbella flavida DSM 17836]|uniref:Sodium/calcium exchanger membrane region n=1 Tax=Kribbella flavida (strain DSM 17836 / JCM 10339 / NBRC 14399) TaxID=479435 RepID=D2Q4U8_KRIFD|nr:sodium/hydrogen exchanger [Kribbella flavida]ADB34203.1 sodium/calcium exchanger membrane region [Kribbella flavida DSM 17836]
MTNLDGMVRALRPVLLCLAVAVPAVALRVTGVHPAAPLAIMVFGLGVVAASFVLAWAAEAAELDISGGLAIALLAVIAVLPEYAVDLYFAHTAGSQPEYVQYAAANMTGSNRLLLGLGWSSVVLVSLYVASRRSGRSVRSLVLDSGYRRELGFLSIAGVVAFVIPLTGQIHLVLGIALLAFFAYYLWRAAASEHGDEPELIGPAARIGALPKVQRRLTVVAMFALAAGVILAAAEPFADSLVEGGHALGIDQFLLVQWLAPLASEAPEFIIALLFAWRGKGAAALGLLISAKVNQWTLLIGSLPIAYGIGGGPAALQLDGRQVEEFLLTATQTLLGIAILLTLRFPRWAAWTLLGLFAVQFAVPGQTGRYVLCGVYAALALATFVHHRREILPTLAEPFRRTKQAEQRSDELIGV